MGKNEITESGVCKNIITIVHNYKVVTAIYNGKLGVTNTFHSHLLSAMFQIAKLNPDALIIWVHEAFKAEINYNVIPQLMATENRMMSYHCSSGTAAGKSLGYVEWGSFVHVDKSVRYPTWIMSSDIGVIAANSLNCINDSSLSEKNFDYAFSSLAKHYMPLGLFCYSAPELLIVKTASATKREWDMLSLYRFVGAHYKKKWIFVLAINHYLYEKKIHPMAFLKAVFSFPKNAADILLAVSKKTTESIHHLNITIDVIIPTIGRKKYLLDFLKDLKEQTLRVTRVIIVEQNPDKESVSELESELIQGTWPFQVIHHFTQQAGACNARNIALNAIESDWVFMADDDIRIEKDFIQKVLENILSVPGMAYSVSCLLKGQTEKYKVPIQWSTFGSGCSFVHASVLKELRFNTAYEFGFAEDADFGMQIRKKGFDIIYLPKPGIVHLKAPFGGFRTKPQLPWDHEPIAPKPSPTILLYKLLHETEEQLKSYKTVSFFTFYKGSNLNILKYTSLFFRKWNISYKWATILRQKSGNQ